MAEVIQKNDTDIIGIQEAAIYYDENSPKNITEELAEELGYHHVFYPAIDFRPEKPYTMGNAIISRYPIKDSKSHELNPEDITYDGTYETEPRILVEAGIDVNGQTLRFLTTHLQYSYKFQTTNIRKKQVQKVLSVIEEIQEPAVLAGDFNAPLENEEIEMIEKEMNRIDSQEPTWTTKPFEHEGWKVDEPEYRLDNIFVSKDLKILEAETIQTELSDHLPVKATVSIE